MAGPIRILCAAAVIAAGVLGLPDRVAASIVYPVSATATFEEADSNDSPNTDKFGITFNFGGPGITISSFSIDVSGIGVTVNTLNSPVVFDVDGGPPGQSPPQSYVQQTGTGTPGTGTASLSPNSKVLSVTMSAGPFDAGDIYRFSIDVDNTAGTNAQQKLVTGAEFAGALFSVTFHSASPYTVGGPFFTFTGSFSPTPPTDPSTLLAAATASGSITIDPPPVPEPSTLVMVGMALCGFAGRCFFPKRQAA